jgi:hypothetical protein
MLQAKGLCAMVNPSANKAVHGAQAHPVDNLLQQDVPKDPFTELARQSEYY